MRSSSKFVACVAAWCAVVALAGCVAERIGGTSSAAVAPVGADRRKTLRAFRSEQELADYFRRLAEHQRARFRERRRAADGVAAKTEALAGGMNANAATAAAAPAQPSARRADASADESITNTQHAGVDEGGIVKLHGDHLVVLRRGRLFTVRVGDGDLTPVASVDAFAPGTDARDDWYDEMLVSDDLVVVIGYSYQRGGTEINTFAISSDGDLNYRSTYHLRSNDYYSSRNYASRLVEGKLVFYTPTYLALDDPRAGFPALRRWHKGARDDEFRTLIRPTGVYRAEGDTDYSYGAALHTVTTCDLGGGDLRCDSTAVVGAPGRVFYVSPRAVYAWTAGAGDGGERSRSIVYRLPLDGSAPSALRAAGSPVDQFSFLESADDHLNVLVRADAAGDQMWSAETAAGAVSLLRVPLASFGDGAAEAPAYAYRELPTPSEGGARNPYSFYGAFQNRFVGDHLIYGVGAGWGAPRRPEGEGRVYVTRWAEAEGATAELPLGHPVDRIEALGADAIVIGADGGDLHFTPVRLGSRPALAPRYTRSGAAQGETRSHGFFYKADDADSGTLGLPIARQGRPGYRQLTEGSAAVLFLRNDRSRLSEVGELAARPERAADDGCRSSCVDYWYGNARPLFVRGRVFALLGYEIVEGRLGGSGIRETRRISFAPRRRTAPRG